jgi:hypothetical protein
MATITVCGTGTGSERMNGELEVVASFDVEFALEQA